MKDWIPKVGDLVTPDPDFVQGSILKRRIGKGFIVTDVLLQTQQLMINENMEDYGRTWRIDRFMPAKNQIVINILNDL